MKMLISYSDAIEKVLIENNYFATLQTIYREVSKYRKLTGKTPFNTIQERVQRDKRFTKVERGVYALTEFLDRLPESLKPTKGSNLQKERIHFSIQGMLLEIGNLLSFNTFSANKNGLFAGQKLSDLMSLRNIPNYTYKEYVNISKRIDVSWFQSNGFPDSFFEVDTTPNFKRSLSKFLDLKPFYVSFCIVSDEMHKNVFAKEIKRKEYKDIFNRCRFRDYNTVERMYKTTYKSYKAKKSFY